MKLLLPNRYILHRKISNNKRKNEIVNVLINIK